MGMESDDYGAGNSKFEARNPKQYQMFEIQMFKTQAPGAMDKAF